MSVDWGTDYRFDRAELAKRLAALALQQGKTAQAERLLEKSRRYWKAAHDDFNDFYRTWCD